MADTREVRPGGTSGPAPTNSTQPQSTAAQLRRRADAALRCPPLTSGHRDPLKTEPTDAPDIRYEVATGRFLAHGSYAPRSGQRCTQTIRPTCRPDTTERRPKSKNSIKP